MNAPVTWYDALNDKVFVLKLIPGLSADILDYLAERYEAVVIEGFGIGGVPSTERQKFCEKITTFLDKGRTLVITTQVPLEGSDLSVYEVGRLFRKDERVLEAEKYDTGSHCDQADVVTGVYEEPSGAGETVL